MKLPTFATLFWKRVNKTNTCWLWTGGITGKHGDSHRYGRIKRDGKRMGAHRMSWQLTNGEIPAGLEVLHKCDIPLCVRPDHLFLGTQADNNRDCVRKKRQPYTTRTQCRRGHPLTDENIYVPPRGKTRRICKLCHRITHAEYVMRQEERVAQ